MGHPIHSLSWRARETGRRLALGQRETAERFPFLLTVHLSIHSRICWQGISIDRRRWAGGSISARDPVNRYFFELMGVACSRTVCSLLSLVANLIPEGNWSAFLRLFVETMLFWWVGNGGLKANILINEEAWGFCLPLIQRYREKCCLFR